MSHSETIEIERKYEVGAETPVPELDTSALPVEVAEVAALDPVELEAVYFDTDDAALARARIALRRRRGGHDEGWHVKLPAAEGRTELQWPLDAGGDGSGSAGDDATVVPAVVLDAVRVHVRDRPVTPLARISTVRRVTELRDAHGAVIAELADDDVAASDVRGSTTRAWREWEVELGAAAPSTPEQRAALLDAIEVQLTAAGATVAASVSKLAQALGRTGLGSGDAAPSRPKKSDDASAVVRAGIASLVARLIELDPAARAARPDAVHRFRTTVRRLRSALATHRRLFDDDEVDALRDSLSRLGAVLGEVRDLEVRAELAEHALTELERDRGIDDPDARRRLVDDTRSEHDEAHRRLLATMNRVPYFRLLDALEEFTGGRHRSKKPSKEPAKKEAQKTIEREGRRALRRSVKGAEVEAALDGSTTETSAALAALHASRTAARRLRLAAEFSAEGPAGVLGSHAGKVAEAAEELQDALGAHRDASLFAEYVLLTARRADAAGESSFTYGVLYQRSIDEARRSLAAADDARRRVKSAL
jgi:CHAD domain-containing protein